MGPQGSFAQPVPSNAKPRRMKCLCTRLMPPNHALNFRQIQSAASTTSEPAKAAITSRSEMAILSRPGQIPNARKNKPPTRAPTRPSARLRNRPKPPRSQVINAPASPPPSSPTTIQTMRWSNENMTSYSLRVRSEFFAERQPAGNERNHRRLPAHKEWQQSKNFHQSHGFEQGSSQYARDRNRGHPGFEPTKSPVRDRYAKDRAKAANQPTHDAAHPGEVGDVQIFFCEPFVWLAVGAF